MSKVCLITGGARGIGKKIAETMSNNGYIVVVNYNSSLDRAMAFQRELGNMGRECLFVKADVSDEVQVENMVELIMSKYGKIDVLVNNSAVTNDSLFGEKSADDFRRVLDVNVVGAFNVSKLVGNIMHNQKYGKIINIASTNGINTYYPMCAEYDASKSALISLTHNLAVQFAPYVNVNAVAPGFIATESELNGMDENFVKEESEKTLVRKVGTEEDVANLVKFLASDEAGYINNEVIRIDGGLYGNM